jgi:hypothetical protein
LPRTPFVQEDYNSIKSAQRIAKMYLKHMTNDKGEVLANVHENVAFQEVYDYHGTEKMRHRLDRKMDQVAN